MRWLLSVGALVALVAATWASDHYISTGFTNLVLMSIVFGGMITVGVAWGVSAAVARFCRQKAVEKAGALSWSPGPAGRIGLLTVAAGASWLMYWALDHAPWAVWTAFGALAVFGAGWGLVKLAENVGDWRSRVQREREILEAIALRQPIRLSAVRIELESMRWRADDRRRERFESACRWLFPFGAWTLWRAATVYFLSVPVVLDLTPTAVVWLWLIAPPLGLVCCAIVAVTNWPRQDRLAPSTVLSSSLSRSAAATSGPR